MIRVAFFVDGFNLFHSIDDLNLPYLKWLNLRKLCTRFIIPKYETIESINYFTALANWQPERVERHKIYIRALESQNVDIIHGKFKRKDVTCKICHKTFETHIEKQTDVNIAINLFKYSVEGRYDKAMIISGDSDLIPSIKAVKNTFLDKFVGVIIPINRKAEELKEVCDSFSKISFHHLESSLFDEVINIPPNIKINCPEKWKRPKP